MKYIDANRLKAEIEKRLQENADKALLFGAAFAGRTAEDNEIINLIDSLQQEQPEMDLEKEIDECAKSDLCPDDCTFFDFARIARHFAEWGARHSINWGDVQLLDTFILELSREEKDGADWGDSEKFYTEVLRRFHEFNDKKIPEIVAELGAEHARKEE